MTNFGRRPARQAGREVVLVPWLALGAAVVTLHGAGGALPGPPLSAPSQWSQWMVGRDPVVVAFGVVRVLSLGVAWYGLVVTAAGVVLRLVSARHLAGIVDRVTVVPLRRLVAATLTVGISVSTLGATATATGAVTGESSTSTSTTLVGGAPAGPVEPTPTITMHRVDAGDTAPPAAGPSPAAPDGPAGPPARTDRVPVPTATWTVEAGQCFWSIAQAQLERAGNREPTVAEIVPYWQRLIEANRAVLGDPHNADLVFPGQVFTLPQV